VGQTTMSGTFFNHVKTITYEKILEMDPGLVFTDDYWLYETSIVYNRRIYGWFDLLGDLGGVTDVLIMIFAIIF
jgi:hypothetical protein